MPLNEYEFPASKISNVQAQLEKLISTNYYLHQSAKDGYRGYLHSYASHALKEVSWDAICPLLFFLFGTAVTGSEVREYTGMS